MNRNIAVTGIGGYHGLPEKVLTGGEAQRAAMTIQRRKREDTRRADELKPSFDEAERIRMASVPFEGWSKEKEVRVKRAVDRILEHDWYDKFENNLKDVEKVHINAVREHFAMRRDRIQTPALMPVGRGCGRVTAAATPRSLGPSEERTRKPVPNYMASGEWMANMEALDLLQGGTNVGTFFRGMVGERRQKRMAAGGAVPRRPPFTTGDD